VVPSGRRKGWEIEVLRYTIVNFFQDESGNTNSRKLSPLLGERGKG
jgi:hypothetical protein